MLSIEGWVSTLVSTISNQEHGLVTCKQNVSSDVLTDVSGYNGVEQCEKCLPQCNSEVHHARFIWIFLPSLCFTSFEKTNHIHGVEIYAFVQSGEDLEMNVDLTDVSRQIIWPWQRYVLFWVQVYILFLLDTSYLCHFKFFFSNFLKLKYRVCILPFVLEPRVLNWIDLNALKSICLPDLTV